MPSKPEAIPILMYHALWPHTDDPERVKAQWERDTQLSDPGARLYALDHLTFERQMQAIVNAGRQSPSSWTRMLAAGNCLITFDDGHSSNHSLAMPILKQKGLRGIFFITTDWIGKPDFMSEAQLRELHESGMLLGTHGCSHRYFSDLSDGELRDELERSRDRLLEIIGPAPHGWPLTVALPGGRSNSKLQSLAGELGYQYLFTSGIGFASEHSPHLNLPRIPITNSQPDDLLPEILTGDSPALKKMARNAELRAIAKSVLGNQIYDRLRGIVIRD